jgi:ribosome-associated protein
MKFIELNTFLKKLSLASTGGQAKIIIRSGAVKVNNEVEKRNRRKLHAKDIVEYKNKKYEVKEELCR